MTSDKYALSKGPNLLGNRITRRSHKKSLAGGGKVIYDRDTKSGDRVGFPSDG